MSSLSEPSGNTGQPSSKLYNTDDIEHLFARREARRDIDRLTSEVLDMNKKVLESNIKQSAGTQALREMISALPDNLAGQITRCREEIRKEINTIHPTRLETMEMRNHIEAQVKLVDSTLGKQISAVDRKLSEEIKSGHSVLSEQIKASNAELKNDIKIQWLKMSIPVGVVGVLAGALAWLLTTGVSLISGG